MTNARPVRSSMVADSIAARQKKSAAVGLALSAGILVAGAPSVAAGESAEAVSVQRAESSKSRLHMFTQQPMITMKVQGLPLSTLRLVFSLNALMWYSGCPISIR